MPARIGRTWQEAHARLLAAQPYVSAPAEALGLAVYFYCVYTAFGQEQDAALARKLYLQGIADIARGASEAPVPFGAAEVAWLHARWSVATPPDVLAALDSSQYAAALRALASPGSGANRLLFLRALRYFSFRLPTATTLVRELLARRPALDLQEPAVFPHRAARAGLSLGLTDGLAGELRLLLRLERAGISDQQALAGVQTGIQHLLATRREVDFLAHRYSVFPGQFHPLTAEPIFSAELSWRHGDQGPALLLYEAHQVLHDNELARIAELVGLHTLLRTTPATTLVTGSNLERGAAGIAHLYRQLHALDRHQAYWKGYVYWLEQTCDWLEREWAASSSSSAPVGSLPHGLAGSALVLLSALVETQPDWYHLP